MLLCLDNNVTLTSQQGVTRKLLTLRQDNVMFICHNEHNKWYLSSGLDDNLTCMSKCDLQTHDDKSW